MPPSPPAPPPFGPLLARSRLARGWSQARLAAELCAAAGVPTLSRHEVSRWERQRRVPGRFWRRWLAEVLAVPADLPAGTAADGHAGSGSGGTVSHGEIPVAPGPADRRAGRRTRPARPVRRSAGPTAAGPPARPASSPAMTRRAMGGSAARSPTH